MIAGVIGSPSSERWIVLTVLGLLIAALSTPPGYWSRALYSHAGWGIGAFGIVVGSFVLQQLGHLPLVTILVIAAATLAGAHDLVASPQRRRAAWSRPAAGAACVLAMLAPLDWRTLFGLIVGVAAATTAGEPRELSHRVMSRARIGVGISAIALGVIGVGTAIALSSGFAISILAVLACVCGAASLAIEWAVVRETVADEVRRDPLVQTTDPCAEIDGNGRVLDFNGAWSAEFGDVSLQEQLGGRAWTVILAAFVEARLGDITVTRELAIASGPAATDFYAIELVPSDGPEATCYVTVRVNRNQPNMEAVDQLHRQTVTDQLTGLLNRRGMEMELAARLGVSETWVVYADLDGFKAVNDGLGHRAGDDVLIEIARRLGVVWRQGDAIARVGGDEFVVLTHTEVAPSRLAECTEALTFEYGGFTVSVSLGLARGAAGTEPRVLLDEADRAMYQIKRQRKQRSLGPSGEPPHPVTPRRSKSLRGGGESATVAEVPPATRVRPVGPPLVSDLRPPQEPPPTRRRGDDRPSGY